MKKIVLVLLYSITFLSWVKGEVDLTSPRSTIESHLTFLQADNFYPDSASQTFEKSGLSKAELNLRAIWLKQILDREGKEIYTHQIPDNKNYIDPVTGNHVYVVDSVLQGIFLEKKEGLWLFSEKSVEQIPTLHQKAYPYGTKYLLKYFANNHSVVIFGIGSWKLVGLLMLLLIAGVVYKLGTFILKRYLSSKWGRKFLVKLKLQPGVMFAILQSVLLLTVFYILTLLMPVFQFPISVGKYLVLFSKALVPVFVTVLLYFMVDVLSQILERKAEQTASNLDDQLVPLFRKSLKAFVIIIGGVFVLQILNFNVTALLAGISIGGLALALAAQDMLKNFFGSIMIFIDRPFQIGDWIISGTIDGSVEEVGFRSTRVRTFADSVVSVPNGKLADTAVDNFGHRRMRRYKTVLSVTYSTSPKLIEAFVDGLKNIIDTHPKTVKDNYHVYLTDFSSSSLDILFYVFFNSKDWSNELKTKHEINLSILELAEKLGVDFAFPTQTIHMESVPDKENTYSDR